jgi:hypothetical protein
MTNGEQIAYIISQSVCAVITMEAMKQANRTREAHAEAPAYDEQAFLDLIPQFDIGSNTVIERLYH